MAEWITPVFDRTSADINKLDRTSVQSQKGALNADDLNRIEGNFQYLTEFLKTKYIFVSHTFRDIEETVFHADGTTTVERFTDWHLNNIPWMSEISRIRAYHNALAQEYLVWEKFDVLPDVDYLDFEEVNKWERFVYLALKAAETIGLEKRYCGTENSGGGMLL